jgi:site-specific DNA recombinase
LDTREDVAQRRLYGAADAKREPDPALVKAVASCHAWFDDLVTERAKSVNEIAAREGLTPRYVSRLLDLAFLPPTLVGNSIPEIQQMQYPESSVCPISALGSTR